MPTLVTTTRLVPTNAAERAVRESWGRLWPRLRAAERRDGHITLLLGDWSGYRSSQRRVTHVDWAKRYDPDFKLRLVFFTDNTTMSVWTEQVTCAEILARGLKRCPSYESLIREAIADGKESYRV